MLASERSFPLALPGDIPGDRDDPGRGRQFEGFRVDLIRDATPSPGDQKERAPVGERIEAKLSCLDRHSEGVPMDFCFVPRMDLLDGLALKFSLGRAEEIRRGAVELADRPGRYIDEEDRIGGPARLASRISSGLRPFWSPSRW